MIAQIAVSAFDANQRAPGMSALASPLPQSSILTTTLGYCFTLPAPHQPQTPPRSSRCPLEGHRVGSLFNFNTTVKNRRTSWHAAIRFLKRSTRVVGATATLSLWPRIQRSVSRQSCRRSPTCPPEVQTQTIYHISYGTCTRCFLSSTNQMPTTSLHVEGHLFRHHALPGRAPYL